MITEEAQQEKSRYSPETDALIAASRASRVDPTALLSHLVERYSELGEPAAYMIEGALDTEIAITFQYGPAGQRKTASATGKTVDEATLALRAKLNQPEEESAPTPAKKAKPAPAVTRSNKGA